ncbi:MAG: pyridoxal phosphate-dependent aminotransferase [Spirochaetales bacterium]|nr:pyridoxal phosphate-dependent aminotransferase [Spirochaetales bacterium]
MSYDFDTPVDRRDTGSYKWDVEQRELPLWVADMDFRTAPSVLDALMKRVEHGIFGYSSVTDDWYDAYRGWWKNRHSFEMSREWLIFSTGVVPAISSIVRKLTTPAEKVLIQSPVYNIFYNSILNNGRQVLESPLVYDEGEYSIDFDDLEAKLSDPQTKMMILCNPHNPVGKIWDRETLRRIGELCFNNGVIVLSDEIHCDLCDPGREYVPFASVSLECRINSVTCLSPSKAFNLAGLHTAAVVVPDEQLRNRVNRGLNTDEVAEPGAFAATAAVSAFTEGEKWLDELRAYLLQNKAQVRAFIADALPEIKVTASEATYLLWLDCRKISPDSGFLQSHIRKSTGLYLTDGAEYGRGGEGFLRMNVSCPVSTLEDALGRLEVGVNSFDAHRA